MVTEEAMIKINDRLTILYGSAWTTGLGTVLYEDFRNLLTDQQFTEALRRHVHDPGLGVYPPKPADIERHLGVIMADANRQQRAHELAAQSRRDDELFAQFHPQEKP